MSDIAGDGLSRRAFGQLLGAAALTGALPDVSLGASSPVIEATSVAADDLCDLTAADLAARVRRKQASARGAMAAHLARIDRVNPRLNAVVTLPADQAPARGKKAAEGHARGVAHAPLLAFRL